MLRLEGYVEIQVLKRQGKSIRAISAELGVSRNARRVSICAARQSREGSRGRHELPDSIRFGTTSKID